MGGVKKLVLMRLRSISAARMACQSAAWVWPWAKTRTFWHKCAPHTYLAVRTCCQHIHRSATLKCYKVQGLCVRNI